MGRQRRERLRMRRFCFGGAPQALLVRVCQIAGSWARACAWISNGGTVRKAWFARGDAHSSSNRPRTLQVWEFGQLAEQALFFLEAPGCPSLDEILVAYGRAKHHDTALFGAQVASPHFVSELGYAWRWGPIPGSNRPCLAQSRPDTTLIRLWRASRPVR